MMIPGPPALVRIATRLPRGRGALLNASAASNSSSTESARCTPHWASNASVAMSTWARAPVWLEAAFAPASDRPAFTTRIGFLRVVSRARLTKDLGLPNDSRYIRITPTSSSSRQYSVRALPETSVLFPTDTN